MINQNFSTMIMSKDKLEPSTYALLVKS